MKARLFALILTLFSLAALCAYPRQHVVVELFTATSCTGCPGSAWAVDDLMANGHPVAPVNLHVRDDFQSPTNNERYDYYEASGTPTAFFDGLNPIYMPSSGLSLYPEYLDSVNSRLLVPSHFSLAALGALDGETCNLTVRVKKEEADSNSNVVLHLSLTETDIPFWWWPDQTQVNFVNRMMVPGASGTPVNVGNLAVGASLDQQYSFELKEEWVTQNLAIVVWLQNLDTKEILQGARFTLDEISRLKSPAPTSSIQNGYLQIQWAPVPFATSYAIMHSYDPQGPFSANLWVDNPFYEERLDGFARKFFRIQALGSVQGDGEMVHADFADSADLKDKKIRSDRVTE